jgi:hypothetical protein
MALEAVDLLDIAALALEHWVWVFSARTWFGPAVAIRVRFHLFEAICNGKLKRFVPFSDGL